MVQRMSRISIDEFMKIDLRVGLVKNAERIPNTRNLIKLEVDFGKETRQIIAGIAAWYKPEELINRRFIFIVNLEPKKIRGLISDGMILAAEDDYGNVYLVTVDGEPPPGSKVR